MAPVNPRLHNVADLERIAELEAEVERLRSQLRAAGLTLNRAYERVNPSGLSLSAGKPRESCEFCGGPEHKDDSECPAWEGA